MKQVEMLQLKADNERMQRTIVRNGLQDDGGAFTEHSQDGSTSDLPLQKKLSLEDPTTFGLSLANLLDGILRLILEQEKIT